MHVCDHDAIRVARFSLWVSMGSLAAQREPRKREPVHRLQAEFVDEPAARAPKTKAAT